MDPEDKFNRSVVLEVGELRHLSKAQQDDHTRCRLGLPSGQM
jgi:hypothetical protein